MEFLSKAFRVEYYGSVAIPALLIAEQDRVRGVLSETQLGQLSQSARLVVANLRQIAEEEEDNEEEVAVETATDGEQGEALQLPSGEGKSIICLGGRGPLDDVSAAMLAQVLCRVRGAGWSIMNIPSPVNCAAPILSTRQPLCFACLIWNRPIARNSFCAG
mgnify:CR=1 FL=1